MNNKEIPLEFFKPEWQVQQLSILMGLIQGLQVSGGCAEEVVQVKQIIQRLVVVLSNPKPVLTGEESSNAKSNSDNTPETNS